MMTKKRILSIVLCLCIICSLLPMTAQAAESVSYLKYNESTKTFGTETATATVVTANDTTWGTAGTTTWYVVQSNIEISNRITVSGDVHLILMDNRELKANGGIQVQDNDNDISNGSTNSLTIYAQSTGENMGKLTANNSYSNDGSDAGIGGNRNGGGGTIIINGGNVTATSKYGAGIGSGEDGGAGGKITINGGNVTANSSSFGAGIGGGEGGAGGEITINGGIVTATGGGAGGAGIGGGGGTSNGSGGTITISGGNVTATGGGKGAGIGGGNNGNATLGEAGTFSTGTNGNAFINASSIQDNDNTTSWSGVIFGGEDDKSTGKVYGSSVELTTDAEIPAGKLLEIGNGQTLTIGEGATLTSNGTIEVAGTIDGNGNLVNNYTIIKQNGATIPNNITGSGSSFDMPEGGKLVGSFIVAGGTKDTENPDYTYENGVLTVLTGTELRIITHTKTTTEKIVVSATTANITLDNVNIDLSGTADACALTVSASSACNLTLVGASTLKSGENKAGINVPSGATLTITSSTGGSLSAVGGNKGAGIGGNSNEAGGTIKITGDAVVTANGGSGGNGIGNGNDGNGTASITINGSAKVNAKGSSLSGYPRPAINGTVTVGGTAVVVAEGYNYGGQNNRQPSITGTLSSEENSTAQIFAFGLQASVITGNFKSGMIFHSGENKYASYEFNEADNGDITFGGATSCLVYGEQTLDGNMTINSGGTLTIQQGATLTIPEGKTLTNNGTLNNSGEIKGEGTLDGSGDYTGGGEISVTTNNMLIAPNFTTQPQDKTITYGELEVAFTVAATGNPAPTYQWEVNKGSSWETISGATDASYTISNPTVSMSGWQYRCVATSTNGSASQSATSEAAALTVNKAAPSYTAPTGLTATYGDKLSSVALTEGWAWYSPSTEVGNVGIQTHAATYTPSDEDNYNAVQQNLTITVGKATPNYTTPTGLTATYGDTLSSVTLPSDANGVWSWADGNQSVGNAGTNTFKATYKPNDTTNYNTVTNINVQVTVKPQPVAIPNADTTTYTYNRQEQTYTLTEDAAYTITGNKKTNANETGYTVIVTLKDATNTQWSDGTTAAREYTFVINKATPTGEPTYTAITTSGKTLADAALGVGDITPDGGTIKWDVNNTTSVTANQSYNWTYTPIDTANYKVLTGSIKLWSYTPPSGGGGGYTPTPSKPQNQPNTSESGGWPEIKDELKDISDKIDTGDIQTGETVTVDMNGATEVPGEVLEEIAGKDINVEFDMGGGVSWTVNGQDIPAGIGDLDLGISTGGNSIPVNVFNSITGETSTVQLELSHDGPFGATLHLSVNLGGENSGYWANLYYYNETLKELVFKHACRIAADGKASWPFDHASSYAIVIDDENHDPNWVNPFTDVDEDDWFYSAVEYVNKHGLMQGTADTLFSPNVTTSRGMIVTILWRLEGEPNVGISETLLDVPESQYYYQAVKWAISKGILEGYGGGKFGPDDPITREQLATILWRYAQYKGIDVSVGEDTNILSYNDGMNVSEYAIPAMQWACGEGIMQGYNGDLTPQGNAKRSEAAAMLMRFLTDEE